MAAMQYKKDDVLDVPIDILDRFAPTSRQAEHLQELAGLYSRHGVTMSKSELITAAAKADVVGEAYEALTAAITEAFDSKDFTKASLASQLEELRHECLQLSNKGGFPITLTSDEAAALTMADGVVTIDEAAKKALYPVKLTTSDATLLNDFVTLVNMANELPSTLAEGCTISIKNCKFINLGLDGYYLVQEQISRLITNRHYEA